MNEPRGWPWTDSANSDGPLRPPNARVEELLHEVWRELMNDASPTAMAFAEGYVGCLSELGVLSQVERDGWLSRFRRCPENTPEDPGHIGGRGWCAYCGSVDSGRHDDEDGGEP